ncbi:hypothetical protein GCM10010240_63520 [Streptomyces griseoviridis]|nr:hypothetical protein GCM10010240_63520 [Streptomyces griseoviridis]
MGTKGSLVPAAASPPPSPAEGPVVVSYGTRASSTRVVARGPHRFHWYRTPGESTVKASYHDLPSALFDPFRATRTPAVRFALPEAAADGDQSYVLPDAVSIGWHLLTGAAVPRHYADVLGHVGEAVHALHHHASRGDPARAVPWLRGLARWLRTRPDPMARHLLHHLGARRHARLTRWAAEALAAPGGPLLGTVTPGTIVVDRRDRTAHLLVTPEAGHGAAVLDLGTLAEALSTSLDVASRGAHRAPENLAYGLLWDAFLAGYGPSPGPDALSHAVALRRVHRLRGIEAHLGDNAFLQEQLDALPELVDQPGQLLIPNARRH